MPQGIGTYGSKVGRPPKKKMGGGMMKKKPVAMKKGSKLRMVEKDGKKVPFFAADGVGKMKDGGATKPKKKPAAMVKPKPRPGSAKTASTTRTRKKGDRAGVTAKKTKRPSTAKKSTIRSAIAKGIVRGVTGGGAAKAAAKLANPNAGSGKDKDGIPLVKLGKPASPKGSQDDKRPAGKLFIPATKSQLEMFRADKRRKQRKKSGQLDQAKKKARKTAVKAMYGGEMKKMRMGGKCRGMGAATKGGNYKMG